MSDNNRHEVYVLVPVIDGEYANTSLTDVYKGKMYTSYIEAYEAWEVMPSDLKQFYAVIGAFFTPVMLVQTEETARAFEGKSKTLYA